VPKGYYVLDSTVFLVGNNLKYILGLLNSNLIDLYVKTYVHLLSDKGFLLSNQYVEKIPLPPITSSNQPIADQIIKLVAQILHLNQTYGCSADISDLETQIDRLVYKLYGLTEEEIKIIERSVP
jgi:hypothetical protein